MTIHINRNGEKLGLYSLEDVNRCLADGTLLPSDLGWHDGAADWVPLTNIEGVVAAGAVPPPTSGAAGATCPNCQAPVEANQIVCMGCGTRLKEAPAARGGKGSKTAMIAVGSLVLIAAIVFGVMQVKTTKLPAKDIFKAAGDGDLEAIKQHIAAGTDLNQRSPTDQSTSLMIAAFFGRTEAAKALIEAGAALDLKKNDGSTALMNAAFMCHTEIVQALLDKDADKNIRNNTGSTALQTVTAPLPLVQLIYGGLDEAIFKPAGITLDMDRIKATRPKIAKMLGGSGGNVSGNNGQAMDIFSVLDPGNEEALKKLIASGVDLNVKGPIGTPLAVAAIYGHTASAMLLINGGADVDAPGNDGSTALHAAAFFCHADIVKALLAKKANVNARNAKGETPLSSFALPWPAAQGIYQLVGGILQVPMDQKELERIQKTRPQIAQMLRQAGGATQPAGSPPSTGLQDAIFNEDLAAVKKLIEAGADINAPKPDDGGTPLHTAAFVCNIEIVKVLIAAKANVNAKNKKGETPLLVVAAPWEAMPGIYAFVGAIFQKKFDLERIQKDRVKVAEILRAAGAQ